ncbi:hypothetical protein NC796_22545 [Aliifodinibius sp. S!AR15-10]|uniref:hypothetical protein n=1 Tax=Aliifodinibius sp. S!AR15-10 TaxID=2950437 RepID=UPI00285CB16D|nr:hypothetical protein [Aliifodinibius sp. S!AR15-10]MDR8393951.1 hypothetical protein [Aliifodinibius sp. S!AR15-10]
MKTALISSVCFWSFLLMCSIPGAFGQDTPTDSTLYRIETHNGNVFIGRLVTENDQQMVLKTTDIGEITIQRSDIKKAEIISPEQVIDGRYWFKNPHSTRYFFSTNARPLGTGNGYYQNTWVLFNNINVGISENISLGGGIVPTFLFGSVGTPVWFLPKVSIPIQNDNVYLSAGAMLGGIIGEENSGLGLLYSVGTIGSDDTNFSLGLGFGYTGDDWSNSPVINASIMHRTGRTFYLITENYLIPVDGTYQGLLSAGVRWAPENFAVDFALARPTEAGDFIGIPWLGVTLPFGN